MAPAALMTNHCMTRAFWRGEAISRLISYCALSQGARLPHKHLVNKVLGNRNYLVFISLISPAF